MAIKLRKIGQGFTLIETLLVMVIIAGFIYMGAGYMQQRTLSLRMDRTSAQIQQILSAGMAYYVANSSWPSSMSDLSSYVPTLVSPWGGAYGVYNNGNNMYVSVQIQRAQPNAIPRIAQTIVGTLPLAFTSTSGTATSNTACTVGGNCFVIATVTLPDQSLSGANAVNFADLYHSGGCVPAPTCPSSGYTAQIIVTPAAVNAIYNAPTGTPCNPADTSGCNPDYIQISGFTAYASEATPNNQPYNCGTTTRAVCNQSVNSAGTATAISSTTQTYWRVCLSITTSSGDIPYNSTAAVNNAWGQLAGTVMAITRCAPASDPTDSNLTVWEP